MFRRRSTVLLCFDLCFGSSSCWKTFNLHLRPNIVTPGITFGLLKPWWDFVKHTNRSWCCKAYKQTSSVVHCRESSQYVLFRVKNVRTFSQKLCGLLKLHCGIWCSPWSPSTKSRLSQTAPDGVIWHWCSLIFSVSGGYPPCSGYHSHHLPLECIFFSLAATSSAGWLQSCGH